MFGSVLSILHAVIAWANISICPKVKNPGTASQGQAGGREASGERAGCRRAKCSPDGFIWKGALVAPEAAPKGSWAGGRGWSRSYKLCARGSRL